MSLSNGFVVPSSVFLVAVSGVVALAQPTPAPILEIEPLMVEDYLASETLAQKALPYEDQRGTGLDGSLRSAAPFGWAVNANPFADKWNEKARYRDVIMVQTGRYSPTEIDIALPAPGFSWTVGRTYTVPEDTPRYDKHTNVPDGYQGLDWHQFSQPEIKHVARTGEDYIYLVYGADRFLEFKQLDETSSVYRGVNGAAGAIVEGVNGIHDTLTYWDQRGTRSAFFDPRDFDNSRLGVDTFIHNGTGQLWTIIDATGNQASVGHASDPAQALELGYDTEGRMQLAYDTAGRKYEYTYTSITGVGSSSGNTATFLTQVEVFEDYDADLIWETTGSKVEYTYFTSLVSLQGIYGNLKEVQTTVPLSGYDPASPSLRIQLITQRYWYHTDSNFRHWVGYFAAKLNGEGYRRFGLEQAADIETQPVTGILEKYRELHIQRYHDVGREGLIDVAHWPGEPGVLSSINFDYSDYITFSNTTNTYDPEHQSIVEIEEGGGGIRLHRYFDEAGQPLSEVVHGELVGEPDMWTYVDREDLASSNAFDGMIRRIATPRSIASANSNPTASTYTPPCVIKANSGGIEVFDRDAGVSSALRGFKLADQWQLGETPLVGDGPHPITSYSYLTPARDTAAAVDVGGYLVIRPFISQIKRHPGIDSGSGAPATEDLSFSYEFHAEALGGGGTTDPTDPLWLRYRKASTTLPIVSTAQLGSGVAESSEEYRRPDGTLVYARDESGIWDYIQVENDLVSTEIEDADLALTSAFAVGEAPADYMASVPSTAGAIHLVTSQVRDEIGRPIEVTHPSGWVQKGYHSSIASGEFTEVWSLQSTGASHFGPALYYAYGHHGHQIVDAEIAFNSGSTTSDPESWISGTATTPLVDAVNGGTISMADTVLMDPSGSLVLANRSYHTLPESGIGVRRLNYDEQWFEYNSSRAVYGVAEMNGTIRTKSFDSFGYTSVLWVDSYDPGEGIVGEWFASDAGGEVPSECSEPCCVEISAFPSMYGNIFWFTKGCNSGLAIAAGIGDIGVTYAQSDVLGRLAFVVNTVAPYEFSEYDNLGRLIASGTYSDIPTGSFTVKATLPAEVDRDNPDIFDGFDSREDSPRFISQYRTSLIEYEYTPHGKLWKVIQHEVDQSSGVLGDSVQSVYAYDESGRLVYINSGRITKRAYDRLGQLSDVYIVAMTDDVVGSYSDLFDVDGDVVVSEDHVSINQETGNTHLYVHIDREPEISGQPQVLDQLDTNDYSDHSSVLIEASKLHGRAQITTYDFDDLERIVRRSVYGTGDTDLGSNFNPITALPSAGITTWVGFGDDGRVESIVDGLGRTTAMQYDLAGKRTQQIDNYVLNGTAVDENRKTEWNYHDTQLFEYVAYVDDTTKQITTYGYGARHIDPTIPDQPNINTSRDYLRSITYPDGEKEEYFYNTYGTMSNHIDRSGNEIRVEFDDAHRPVLYHLYNAGTDFTADIQRSIELGYNSRGMISTIKESDGNGATELNTVSLDYDGWGALSAFKQQDDFLDSLVGSSIVKERSVGYAWESSNTGSSSTLRLSEFGYLGDTGSPTDDIPLAFHYTGSTNNGLSRVASMALNGVTVANYEYLGIDRISKVSYPENDVYSNLQNAGNSYDALDRYNRVIRSRWNRTRATNEVAFYDSEVIWDDGSNITGVTDHVYGDDFNFKYVNDGLDRLTQSQRGAGTGALITTLREQADWDLGKVGTWDSSSLDLNGDLDYSDADEFQADNGFDGITSDLSINQLTKIEQDTDNTPGYENTFFRTYDDNGNLKSAPDRNQNFKWDYLGRLIEVTADDGGTIRQVAEFKYNGLGYRIAERLDSNGDGFLDKQVVDGGNGDDTVWRRLIYDAQWRVVEVYEVETAAGLLAEQLAERHVHHGAGLSGVGTGSYIDSVVLRDRDTDENGSLEERHYYCQNWRADVVAVIDDVGSQVEQTRYTAYGTPYAIPFIDQNRDGAFNFFDLTLMQSKVSAGVYDVTADGNLDGLINFFDLSHFLNQNTVINGQAMGRDVQSTYGHNRGYAGYWRVDELKLSHVRHRWYDAGNGTWISKDPAGYVDGASLYGYVAMQPMVYIDPSGLLIKSWPNRSGGNGGSGNTPSVPYISSPKDFMFSDSDDKFTDSNDLYDRLANDPNLNDISMHGNKKKGPYYYDDDHNKHFLKDEPPSPEQAKKIQDGRGPGVVLNFIVCNSDNPETDDAFQKIADNIGVPVGPARAPRFGTGHNIWGRPLAGRPKKIYSPGGTGPTATPNPRNTIPSIIIHSIFNSLL